MVASVWFLAIALAVAEGATSDPPEGLADTIKLLREQVNALLDHRQEDYNALEDSLKRAIEKNTELFVLRNEIKQLRKDVNGLRGGSGAGNEAKNERLRVRWLGSAVTELQSELAEVLRARNASEELAERSRMRSELALLKGDVAEVGRGIRNLGGRIAKIEAALGTIRVDIAAVKERSSLLSRGYADITSQVSAVQMEVKSPKSSEYAEGCTGLRGKSASAERKEPPPAFFSTPTTTTSASPRAGSITREHLRRRFGRRRGYSSSRYRLRLADRLKSLERKISAVSHERASLEERVAHEGREYLLGKRVGNLERAQDEISELASSASNASERLTRLASSLETKSGHLASALRGVEARLERSRSETKRELSRLTVEAARRAAELSLTREDFGNLRRAVQALSVSASKLQERTDRHGERIDHLDVALLSSSSMSWPSLADRFAASCQENPNGLTAVLEPRASGKTSTVMTPTTRIAEPDVPSSIFCRRGGTVMARRIDGSLDFDRTWSEYARGFGSALGEFWIGNELLHRLTRSGCASLAIDLLEFDGTRWRAEYDRFLVESEETGYALRVSGYSGNATDALSFQSGVPFSAKDRDGDSSRTDCAANYGGGWWFSHCQHVNLNGKYSLGLTWFRSDVARWISVASSEMSLRFRPNCPR